MKVQTVLNFGQKKQKEKNINIPEDPEKDELGIIMQMKV